MKTSVILCTFNRSESLRKTLTSLAASTLPASVEWEVLVVDNNSSDSTRETIEQFSRQCPECFRYLFEPRQGKSYALNSGIREANGEVLAFVDDDVTVESTWLDNLTAPLHRNEAAGVGGRTLLAGEFTPPRWMSLTGSDSLGGVLAALFDLGDEPCILTEAPFGTNMAFKSAMFDKYGLFRVDLGPRPGSQIRNEDTEFGTRLLVGKECLRYVPNAIVHHSIPQNRLNKSYFLCWHYDWGRALVRNWKDGRAVLGIPRPYLRMFTMLVRIVCRIMQWTFSFKPQHRFHAKCLVWAAAGQIAELYQTTAQSPMPSAAEIENGK